MMMHELATYASEGPASVDVEIDRPQIDGPEAAFEQLRHLQEFDRECCMALMLDTKHRLIRREVVSLGSIDHTFMSAREIYRDALLAGAAAIVLAHNHPSGDHQPSNDDELVTRRLAKAGELIGIELLDHLVLGQDDSWTSMARKGHLP